MTRGLRVWVPAAAVVVMVLGSVTGSPADVAPNVSVTVGPKWGAVPPGSWTPYVVTVHNEGGVDIEGEIVLAPQPGPPPRPGVRRAPPATAPRAETVPVMGNRVLAAPPLKGPGARTKTPPWPTYRAPVSVAAGAEKTLTVMVLQAPFGFGVQLMGGGGRVVAAAPGPLPVAQARFNVLLLSEVVGADVRLKGLPHLVAPGLDVTQLRTAREFPAVALHLAGVDAVVIDDFDTAALSERQRRALQDYVSLGGSLVVTGGAAWSRTLRSLPPGLVPLHASGSTPASMGPLADLLAGTTTAGAEVATGEVTAGQAVLGAPGGPPLVVEADYRAGRVVQLSFDPLAEPIVSDPLLEGVAWDQTLARVESRWGLLLSLPERIAEDQLWAPALAAPPWPTWTVWEVGLLAAYALIVVPATLLVSRRARRAAGRVMIAVVVVTAGGACLALAGARGAITETIIEVQTPGADATVLTTAYRGLRDVGPRAGVAVPPGAASTVFSDRPLFGAVQGEGDPLLSRVPPSFPHLLSPVARGLGGGTVLSGGERPGVRLAARPPELQTVQTVSVGQGGPDLEADLRLAETSRTSPGRVRGTVTNRGRVPIRRLRAQTPNSAEGQAQLVDVLGPGETKAVDAPLTEIDDTPITIALKADADHRGAPPSAEEVAMFAAASRAFSGPDQVAVTGVTEPITKPRAEEGNRRISVVVIVVPLQGAENTRNWSGPARLISVPPLVGPHPVAVSDLRAPPGAGPLTIRYLVIGPVPGQPLQPPVPYEVYSWATGKWRVLPEARGPSVETPLEQAEVNNGLVRFRVRSVDSAFLAAYAQLSLTRPTS